MEDNRVNSPECGCCESGHDCAALMRRLRKVDFAIYDTVLYLDVYPDCVKAQEFYQKLICERDTLCRQVNTRCGALTFNNVTPGKWSWTKGPWPWEPGAN